jgi:LPXTG-motif cell wall-anchored protein
VFAAVSAVATVGLVAFAASPAAAHHSTITGEGVCDTSTGTWVVTWTVANSEDDLKGQITDVNSVPASPAVTNIVVGAWLPKKPGTLSGTQVLPGNASNASLEVKVHWKRYIWGHWQDIYDTAKTRIRLGGKCEEDKPSPSASFSSACDGTVTVTLANGADARRDANFVVNGANGFTASRTVAPDGSDTVVVPAANAGSITVLIGEKIIAEGGFVEPECPSVEILHESDCDNLYIKISNPEGNRPASISLTDGTTPQQFSLAAGESKELTFPGQAGLSVAITVNGSKDPQVVTWEPGDCPTPTPPVTTPPATTPPPGLPDTGTSLGSLIAVAVALIAVGAGLLFVLRRRRAGEAV